VALSWHESAAGTQQALVPGSPTSQTWPVNTLSPVSQNEALSAGDIDRDGDLDLLLGTKWLRNDGSSWTEFTLNTTGGEPDRNRLADINGDGKLDAVIGFEAISLPGKLAWYEQGSAATGTWVEHIISESVIGPMSLDVADMDGDGDLDVVVGEHNTSDPASAAMYIFENVDGKGLILEKAHRFHGRRAPQRRAGGGYRRRRRPRYPLDRLEPQPGDPLREHVADRTVDEDEYRYWLPVIGR
jgi:hypothetical protein